MRRFVIVLWAAMVGILVAGLTSAFAGTGIVQEETVVFGEHTLKGRNLDLVGEADDFRPGDRYIFRSEQTLHLLPKRRRPACRVCPRLRRVGAACPAAPPGTRASSACPPRGAW